MSYLQYSIGNHKMKSRANHSRFSFTTLVLLVAGLVDGISIFILIQLPVQFLKDFVLQI